MRWFKHLTAAHADEKLSELMDAFGAEGYGVWWLIMEKIGGLFDENKRTFARYSLKVWSNFCKVSPKKFKNIIIFLEKREIFFLEYEENYITVNCPNLLKYRDEYSKKKGKDSSKKSGVCPESLRSLSGVSPEQDTDTDTDTDTDIKEIQKGISLSGKPDDVRLKNLEFKKQAKEILKFLNDCCGKNFEFIDANLDFIAGRLKKGATVDQCRQVIAMKRREWIDDPAMKKCLRPATLFNKTKFAQYVGELVHDAEKLDTS